MVTIEDFIQEQRVKIQDFSQQEFSWDTYRNIPAYRQPSGFQLFLQTKGVPKSLHRDWIIQQFKNRETYYNGFVSAMLWGGINPNRPLPGQQGNFKTTNFFRAFSVPKDEIVENLEQTKTGIENNQIGQLHTKYLHGKFKIPGVGESFFTKLLFFAGMNTSNPVKPLIYDKWTKIMHIWILLCNNDLDKISGYYSFGNIYRNLIQANPPKLLSTCQDAEADAYVDYVQQMNRIANQHNLNVSNLESYLFGIPMRGQANRDPLTNPRVFMMEQIKQGWREKNLPER